MHKIKFDELAKDIIEEIGKELQLIAELNSENFSFAKQDVSMFFRNMLRIGSIIFKMGGFITTIFPPISFALKAAGWMLSLVGKLFQSKEEKKKKAIEHISNSLMKQIEKQKKYFINEYLKELKNYCDDVSNSTNNYFQMIIESLYLISRQLIKTEEELKVKSKFLNYAYAKRIVDWYIEKSQAID